MEVAICLRRALKLAKEGRYSGTLNALRSQGCAGLLFLAGSAWASKAGSGQVHHVNA